MTPDEAARMAEALIVQHLPGRGWTFGLDRATRRAGACHYDARRITVSRHLLPDTDEAELRLVLLHEIAHAIAGHAAAHGPAWKAAARRIGSDGQRLHPRQIAEDRARWVGSCPAGHEHRRFRRPSRQVSCGRCSRTFTRAAVITWRRSVVTP